MYSTENSDFLIFMVLKISSLKGLPEMDKTSSRSLFHLLRDFFTALFSSSVARRSSIVLLLNGYQNKS